MSEIKVNSIKGVGASAAAITVNNTDGTCTANITNNLSNRNLIINGAMQVAQRGGTAGAHNSFAVDRFKFKKENTAANFDMTQSTTSPDGFSKSLKVDCTAADTSTAATEFVMVRHIIEAQNLQQLGYGTSAAKPLVLSFYVRSNVTGTYAVNCIQSDNSSKIYVRTYTINSADTWEKKTISIPADTSGVINDDNGEGLQINFALVLGSTYTSGSVSTAWESYSNSKFAAQHGVNIASSTSNEWYLTGVQLEVGSVATDFEHRSFDDELNRCFRYCQVFDAVDGEYTRFAFASASGSNVVRVIFPLQREMRAKPSVAFSGSFECPGVGGFNINNVINETNTGSRKAICLQQGSVSVTAYQAFQFNSDADTSAKVTFTSEL